MPAVPPIADSPAALDALARASVLYTDLDGTLLGPGGTLLADADGAPSATAAEAVVAVNRVGLDVRVCSGRSRAQLSEITRVCGWSGFIAELGCVVVPARGEPPVYHIGEWPDGAVAAGDTPYRTIERAGALERLREAFPDRIEQHTLWHADREVTHVLRGNIDVDAASAILASLDPPVGLVDNGVIRPPRHTLVGVDEVHAYHLVPAGATKSGAVAEDLARRGLAAADAIAIGDSEIDVGMAGEVALMVLVANALEDERVAAAAALHGNVVRTLARRGEGWAEMAHLWLAARG